MNDGKDSSSTYRSDYPNEPIGGSACGRSDPEINGRIEGHNGWCSWRLEQERASGPSPSLPTPV